MSTGTETKRPFRVRAKRTFRRRWVQACIVVLVWLLVMITSVSRFGPKSVAKGTANDTSKFKFMHCDNCKLELTYNAEMDGRRCPRCQPPKEGFFVGTEKSIKSGVGSMSPWQRVYVALFVETVLMLALMTYLMYRPVPDPTNLFFVVVCPFCNQRLRYRAVSHGGQGGCSRCKRLLRFPEEEDAVSEAEAYKAEEQAALAEIDAAEAEAEAQATEAEAAAAAAQAEADARATAEAEAAQAEAARAAAAAANKPRAKQPRPKKPRPKTK